ncbi:Molydopterin dinucleotide binding domain-containing protein [Streptomyces sp. Ncost-T10-10d]|nr:Molydopterin dinucleotide binding domain-containing protein [Streptomyces sp. Ncost-T10-10d]
MDRSRSGAEETDVSIAPRRTWATGMPAVAVRTRNSYAMLRAPQGHRLLQTLCSHDQWNTVPYTDNDRCRGVRGTRRVVLVSPADLTALGLSDGERVDLMTVRRDGIERRAEDFRLVTCPTAPGCGATHSPETDVLVPLDSRAGTSNTPEAKGITVGLQRTTPRAAGATATATATAPWSDGP